MSETYYETWKGIAAALGRSERWCRYTAAKSNDPLPVFKLGGIVRLNHCDLVDWLERQKAVRPTLNGETRVADISWDAAELRQALGYEEP